jgi:hypothetical protein
MTLAKIHGHGDEYRKLRAYTMFSCRIAASGGAISKKFDV